MGNVEDKNRERKIEKERYREKNTQRKRETDTGNSSTWIFDCIQLQILISFQICTKRERETKQAVNIYDILIVILINYFFEWEERASKVAGICGLLCFQIILIIIPTNSLTTTQRPRAKCDHRPQ